MLISELFESFTAPKQWKWVKKDTPTWIAQFESNGRHVTVNISGKQILSLNFDVDGDQGLTGGGDAFSIFSTVMDIVKNCFRERPDIKEIGFGAKNNQQSRVKFYQTLTQKIAQSLGWQTKIWNSSNETIYSLVPKAPRPSILRKPLQEAPLADYQLHGKWDNDSDKGPLNPLDTPNDFTDGKNSFVSKRDRYLLQNENIQSRLKNLLARFPTPIHLIIWNSPAALDRFYHSNLDYGELFPAEYRWFPNEIRKQIKQLPSDSIGVILTHNDGGEIRHPMTPWMIIHRISHALMQFGIMSSFRSLFDAHIKPEYDKISEIDYIEWLRQVCTFKSARDNKILSDMELLVELMTQYIIKGKVIISPAPIQITNNGYVFKLKNKDEAVKISYMVEDFFNDALERIILNAIGSVWVC